VDLEQILSPVADDLEVVEERLLAWADGEMKIVAEELARVVSAGGKRIRPACVLLAAHLGAGESVPDRAFDLAAAVEVVHTASLIHDDIVDGSSLRRGEPTLHARRSVELALLIGDLLYSKVLRRLSEEESGQSFRLVADTVSRMVSGELAETLHRNDTTVQEDDYLETVRNKTAALFACAAQLGAIAGGLSAEACAHLRDYGERIGMAFQIVDDVLDVCEEERELGKPVGADIGEGKVTLPLIHAIAQERGTGRRAIEELVTRRDVPTLRTVLHEAGSLLYAIDKADAFAREAAGCVSGPNGWANDPRAERCRQSLIGTTEYVVARGRGAIERTQEPAARSG
jgi:octaprenyl-diphosphate synthase